MSGEQEQRSPGFGRSEDELFLGAGDFVDPFMALRAWRGRTGTHAHSSGPGTDAGEWIRRDEEQGRGITLSNSLTYQRELLAQNPDGFYVTTAAGAAYLKNPPSQRPFGSELEDEATMTPQKRQAVLEAAECMFCHELVDPTAPGTWQQVTGWVQLRKGGGSNKLAHRSAPMGYAHRDCLK